MSDMRDVKRPKWGGLVAGTFPTGSDWLALEAHAADLLAAFEAQEEQASLFRRLCMEYGWDSTGDPLAWLKIRLAAYEAQERGCRHGWRGTPAEPIRTPCPTCGLKSLFIGTGGHLTCASVPTDHTSGCPEPGVERAVEKLKAQLASLRDELATGTIHYAGVSIGETHRRLGQAEAALADAQKQFDEERAMCLQLELDAGKAQNDLAEVRGRLERVVKALETIRDRVEDGAGYCNCAHDDEDCCAKIGYFCHQCIAAVALAAAKAHP
jgi:hypothetical protein